MKVINNLQSITRGSLGKLEAAFITKIGTKPIFSIDDARNVLGQRKNKHISQFLERLQHKGWIRRLKRGLYALIPLSSGEDLRPQIHEFLLAMELVTPAAIAYWTALNHHGMTEQIPRTVMVATNHPVRYLPEEVLGISFKIVSLRPARFFGIMNDWIDERQFKITDKEKTIIDGLDIPKYVGGLGEIAKALTTSWKELDEVKLRNYAFNMKNSAVVKRLGFLMEALGLGDPQTLRKEFELAAGFSLLDPTLPKKGKYNRHWRLLINCKVA